MRLFHFSDDPGIETFVPRAVPVPSERGVGRAWLNGPLVWAVDERHQPMYLFPRECPRILLWATPETKAEDRAQWFARLEKLGAKVTQGALGDHARHRASASVSFAFNVPTGRIMPIGGTEGDIYCGSLGIR